MKPTLIAAIVALHVAHGEAGVQKPAEPSIVKNCDELWNQIPEDIRMLLTAMIDQADAGIIIRADLADYEELANLQDEEKIAIERLLALRDRRVVTFSTGIITVHPPRPFEVARASDNGKYSLGQPKKSRPSRSSRG
ncbi:MAG: hypothetical protein RLZZ517_436 [Candidatus Parcubacteria bacterium]|jgi:hypothetical protein